MFFILHRRVKELFNFGVEGCQPFLFLSVGEVNIHICSRGDDVEFRIKHIYPMNNTIKSGKGERSVTLILTNSVFAKTIKGKQC